MDKPYVSLINEYCQRNSLPNLHFVYYQDKLGWNVTVNTWDGQQFKHRGLTKSKAKEAVAEVIYNKVLASCAVHSRVEDSYNKSVPNPIQEIDSSTSLAENKVPTLKYIYKPLVTDPIREIDSSVSSFKHQESTQSTVTGTLSTSCNTPVINPSIQEMSSIFTSPFEDIKHLFIIDLENVPQCKNINFNVIHTIAGIGFLSHSHSLIDHIDDISINMFIHTVNSTRKDVADHYISFKIGQIILQNLKYFTANACILHIITQDNFGGCLCEIITNEYGLNTKQYTTFKQVREVLSELRLII